MSIIPAALQPYLIRTLGLVLLGALAACVSSESGSGPSGRAIVTTHRQLEWARGNDIQSASLEHGDVAGQPEQGPKRGRVQRTASLGRFFIAFPEVRMKGLMATTRMNPPPEGMNRVWVTYHDQTGQGKELEDAILEELQDAMSFRGYVAVDHPAEADYVLWATTRLMESVVSKQSSRRGRGGLGAVAGPIRGNPDRTPVMKKYDTWGGLGDARSHLDLFLKIMGQMRSFQCVTDVQIVSRRARAKSPCGTSEAVSDSRGALPSSLRCKPGDIEPSIALDHESAQLRLIREEFFTENEQRLLLEVRGKRMDLDQAKEIMIPKLIYGLAGQLVKYRGG